MIIALFEDETYENFLPITYTRPVYECRAGMYTLRERVQKSFPTSKLICFARSYLAATLRKRFSLVVNNHNAIDDDILLINGTLILNETTEQLIEKKHVKDTLAIQNGRIAYAHLSQKVAQ